MKKERLIEILILIVLFIAAIAAAVGIKHYKFDKPNTYTIIFQDIDSIVKGSPVRFMGINIGHVIRLKRKDKFIICKIKVTKKGVKIPNATRAKVEFNGLGGSKSIELTPPLTNDPNIKGIVANDSLRINDFVAVVKDLKDVCKIIDDFVQGIDTDAIMSDVKDITNPEMIDRVDSDMQKMLDRKNEFQGKENSLINFMKMLEASIGAFLNQ